MNIRGDEYIEIMNYLVKERWAGNEFVAYLNDSTPVYREDLACFGTPYEAKEYCYEMSTDVDFYDYMAIRSVYRTMEEAIHDRTLYIASAGVVDISAMVMLRQQRIEEEQSFNNQNNKVMNEKNFEYLRDQVKYTGFGESLEYDLKEQIKKGEEKFTLNYKNEYGNDKVDATLNFKKSSQGDMYFFNSYDVKLQKEKADNVLQQTFYINNKGSITMKEAYNLMEGRSVNKNLVNQKGEEYNAWVKLDFKQTDNQGNYKMAQFGEKYGYNLDTELKKHPIKELTNDEYKKDLIDSLKKGNVQSATFVKDGIEVKQYIEASPQYKNINLYDANMQRMDSRQSQGEKEGESKDQSAKQEKKNAQNDEEGAGGQKERKKRGQHI
jgi:hypothetical protein